MGDVWRRCRSSVHDDLNRSNSHETRTENGPCTYRQESFVRRGHASVWFSVHRLRFPDHSELRVLHRSAGRCTHSGSFVVRKQLPSKRRTARHRILFCGTDAPPSGWEICRVVRTFSLPPLGMKSVTFGTRFSPLSIRRACLKNG